MHISINNTLPSIYLNVGSIMDDENKMRMLVDTGVVMNTGNIVYHQWVLSQYLSMATGYLDFSADTEYDLVKLLVALDLKGIYQHVGHISMTVVIRYRTPYLIKFLFLFFLFLWVTMLHYTAFLASLVFLAMGDVSDLIRGQLVCLELNQVFMLHLDPSRKGLLDGATYNTVFDTVPDGVPSNVLLLSLPIQYTVSDKTITPVSQILILVTLLFR